MPMPKDQPQAKPGFEDEGEGNRTAARRYNAGVEKTVKSGSVEKAAKAAEDALESDEGDELREAEAEAKSVEPEPARSDDND